MNTPYEKSVVRHARARMEMITPLMIRYKYNNSCLFHHDLVYTTFLSGNLLPEFKDLYNELLRMNSLPYYGPLDFQKKKPIERPPPKTSKYEFNVNATTFEPTGKHHYVIKKKYVPKKTN